MLKRKMNSLRGNTKMQKISTTIIMTISLTMKMLKITGMTIVMVRMVERLLAQNRARG